MPNEHSLKMNATPAGSQRTQRIRPSSPATARAAGMTQGTIYNYVRSKDDILYLVCDRIVSEYQEETRKALASSHDPAARIRSAVHAVCEVMYQHQEEIPLIYQDSHLLEPRSLRVILARVEEFIGMFETIVGQALREVPGPKPNTRLAAQILTFLPVMLALRRWSLYRDLTREQVVDCKFYLAITQQKSRQSGPSLECPESLAGCGS